MHDLDIDFWYSTSDDSSKRICQIIKTILKFNATFNPCLSNDFSPKEIALNAAIVKILFWCPEK